MLLPRRSPRTACGRRPQVLSIQTPPRAAGATSLPGGWPQGASRWAGRGQRRPGCHSRLSWRPRATFCSLGASPQAQPMHRACGHLLNHHSHSHLSLEGSESCSPQCGHSSAAAALITASALPVPGSFLRRGAGALNAHPRCERVQMSERTGRPSLRSRGNRRGVEGGRQGQAPHSTQCT